MLCCAAVREGAVRQQTSSAAEHCFHMPEVCRGRADFKNVSIVAHYIKERTKDAQFIIISLRNNMFELADRLVRAPPGAVTLTLALTPPCSLRHTATVATC